MSRLVLAAMAFVPAMAGAQTRVEVRFEAVDRVHSTSGAEAAFGVRTALGPYLRLEGNVGGAIWHSGSPKLPSPRSEAAIRFLLDPINEQKWGLSFAGGLGYVGRPYLLFVTDLEGQPMGGWRPAFRFALGGGLRFGLVLRRIVPNRR